MTLARKFLDEISEVLATKMQIKSGTKAEDFDTQKLVTLKSGKYEVIDSTDPDKLLISDTKGNLYYLKQ